MQEFVCTFMVSIVNLQQRFDGNNLQVPGLFVTFVIFYCSEKAWGSTAEKIQQHADATRSY